MISNTPEPIPTAGRGHLTAEELVARHKNLPRVDYQEMRQEAAALFGEDRLSDADDRLDESSAWSSGR